MTLEEFIKTFLPNFDERWERTSSELKQIHGIELIRIGFNATCFEEALENFTNKICEKQKEMCARDVELYMSIDMEANSRHIVEVIDGSFTPKIEDL